MSTKKKNATVDYGEAPRIINDRPFYGLTLDNDQINFVNAILNPDNTIVFCNAKAGSGKTTLSIGTADILVKHNEYEGIVYICSAYGDKRGYLPGTLTEKSEVYFEPAYQAMIECNMNPNCCVNSDSMVNQKYGTGIFTPMTDVYILGSDYKNKFIIIDEAQCMTKDQLKAVLTRCHDDCKVVVIGSTLQVQGIKLEESGLNRCIKHFSDRPWAQICHLSKNYRGEMSAWADRL